MVDFAEGFPKIVDYAADFTSLTEKAGNEASLNLNEEIPTEFDDVITGTSSFISSSLSESDEEDSSLCSF